MMRFKKILTLVVLTLVTVLVPAGARAASTPNLFLHTFATPTSFSEADNAACPPSLGTVIYVTSCDEYQITATNIGASATSGSPITLTDTLPEGLEAIAIQAELKLLNTEPLLLTGSTAKTQECKIEVNKRTVSCKFLHIVHPDEALS